MNFNIPTLRKIIAAKARRALRKGALAVCLLCASLTASSQNRLFEYPVPPEELTSLQDRTSYLVERFWDKCNVVSAISNPEAFDAAFADYVSFMPYADAEVVFKSIDTLINRFSKNPDKLLTLAEIAEKYLYNPNAEFTSDEAFLPFARAAAQTKKIPAERKKHFAELVKILETNQVNFPIPDFDVTLSDGSRTRLSSLIDRHTLIFINDDQNSDCSLQRVRLAANSDLNDIIDRGSLNVICIYQNPYSAQWAESVAGANPRWKIACAPNMNSVLDLRHPPVVYYVKPDKIVLSKHFAIDDIIRNFHVANIRQKEAATDNQ